MGFSQVHDHDDLESPCTRRSEVRNESAPAATTTSPRYDFDTRQDSRWTWAKSFLWIVFPRNEFAAWAQSVSTDTSSDTTTDDVTCW